MRYLILFIIAGLLFGNNLIPPLGAMLNLLGQVGYMLCDLMFFTRLGQLFTIILALLVVLTRLYNPRVGRR